MPSFKKSSSINIALALLLALGAVYFSAGICSAEETPKQEFNTYEGRVSYLDWVSSEMSVNGVGTLNFYVPREAKISKLGRSITFADLNILDNVIIKYYREPTGRNVVVRITVTVV